MSTFICIAYIYLFYLYLLFVYLLFPFSIYLLIISVHYSFIIYIYNSFTYTYSEFTVQCLTVVIFLPPHRGGEYISTGSDCVLHQPPKDTSTLPRHLLCLHLNRDAISRRTVARDLSLLQPLTVALFAGDELEVAESPEGALCVSVDGSERTCFQVDKR